MFLERIRRFRWGFICLCVAVIIGCDSGSVPVAPASTTITLSANPLSIPPDGTATVQAIVRNGGAPVRSGTEVQFQTTLGQIDALAATDGNGVAQVTLQAAGHVGMATVTAGSGANTSNTVMVTFAASTVTANFTPTVDGLTVIFDNTSTGNPTAYAWDFGDGRQSNERDPVHTYSAPGDYVVRLTVSDATSQDSQSQTVNVRNEPLADFSFTKDGLRVLFADRSSGDPTEWTWDFGDGSTPNTTQNPSHTYGAAGSYRVVLTATNAEGSDTRSRVLDVEAAPAAGFTEQVSGLSVIFTDTSTGPPTSWTWDFGDGNGSSAPSPSHTYAAPGGTFTVTLTVTNGEGSSSVSKFVTVAEP